MSIEFCETPTETRKRKRKEYTKKYYAEHKEYYREINKRRTENGYWKKFTEVHNNLAKQRKVSRIKLYGSICEICGMNYDGRNGACFEFHHINKKQYPDLVLLVCNHCHRKIHFGEY